MKAGYENKQSGETYPENSSDKVRPAEIMATSHKENCTKTLGNKM